MVWKSWIDDFPDLSKSCEFICLPQLFFLVGCWNKCGLWEIWNSFLTLLNQKQDECHLRIVYQSYEDLLQVFLWSISIQTTHQFQFCLVFWAHVHLLDSLKLSLRCKRYSFIYSSVCAVKLWNLGRHNLFYPKRYRIFAVYQWLLDALSFTKFYLCLCLFFGPR